ncbi:MAG: response regulator transcription factor [Elusimicrobia bacterium]|nr:response regulator transcription factor [Elusimicrobiota bacterium]
MRHKALIVDDDKSMLQITRRYLENHDFQVIFTENPSEALLLAKDSKPDLIITDAEMPGLDGFSLCKAVKENSETSDIPVIIVSGKKLGEGDIIKGYERGADDYLIKPFSFPILLAKANAVLRRYDVPRQKSERISKLNITIDPSGRAVKIQGKTINLTRKEFDLLVILMTKEGKVLSIPYLLETVWGYDPADYNDPHTIEVHMSSLRKKLGPRIAKHFISLTGHGYKFAP